MNLIGLNFENHEYIVSAYTSKKVSQIYIVIFTGLNKKIKGLFLQPQAYKMLIGKIFNFKAND